MSSVFGKFQESQPQAIGTSPLGSNPTRKTMLQGPRSGNYFSGKQKVDMVYYLMTHPPRRQSTPLKDPRICQTLLYIAITFKHSIY